jgi:hypothetical protein
MALGRGPDPPPAQLQRAEQLRVPIWSQAQFLDACAPPAVPTDSEEIRSEEPPPAPAPTATLAVPPGRAPIVVGAAFWCRRTVMLEAGTNGLQRNLSHIGRIARFFEEVSFQLFPLFVLPSFGRSVDQNNFKKNSSKSNFFSKLD